MLGVAGWQHTVEVRAGGVVKVFPVQASIGEEPTPHGAVRVDHP